MSDLKGIYALWYREFKVFQRERSRIVASIVNPVLWLLIIGGGLGSVLSFGGVDYLTFLYPGILVQSLLFSAVFFGVYIVWDKKIDFLKEVLVSPMSRTSIFIGKILGGSTDTLLQSAILLVIGCVFTATGVLSGITFSLLSVAISCVFLFVTTVGLVSIGLIIGSQMESPEGFQLDQQLPDISHVLPLRGPLSYREPPGMAHPLRAGQPCYLFRGRVAGGARRVAPVQPRP